MSKQHEADLILKLYELRREPKMRQARDWFVTFAPQSFEDLEKVMFSEQGSYFRMVTSYWEMASALVLHGGISIDLFNDSNGEHFGVFSKIEPVLGEIRANYGPQFAQSLEKLVDATPGGRERVATYRERMKEIMSKVMAMKAAAGGQE